MEVREARVCHGQAHSSDSSRELLAARGLQRFLDAHGHGVLHRLGKPFAVAGVQAKIATAAL